MVPIAVLIPDTGISEIPRLTPIPPSGAPSAFGAALDAAGASLARADAAETAFTSGTGGLAEMVVERARADIALSVAATGAQHAAQALNTLLGMQV